MTNKRIVYTRPDGGVSILAPAPEFLAQFATEEEGIAAIQAKDVPSDAVAVEVIDETAIPERSFRNAWEWNNGIQVNMPKARVVHMDKIRRVRNDELEKLDISFMRAIEAGDAAEQTSITNQKQALRDIPQELDLEVFATPEDLHASWADNLVRPEGEVTES